MTRNQALQHITQKLEAAGFSDPAMEARYLLAASLHVSRLELLQAESAVLNEQDKERLHLWLARRLAHEPLARIEGVKEFWGLKFMLNAETLEPRPDSEALIEAVLEFYPDRAQRLRVLDLGTGTGCLLLAILHEYENANGSGTDLSPKALEAAGENAAALKLDARAQFLEARWTEGIEGPFDIIVSNPPYIESVVLPNLQPEVRLYDPMLALDGGLDGLKAYRELLPPAHEYLKPGGRLFCEIGFDQAQAVNGLFAQYAFTDIALRKDLGGNDRVVLAKKI